MADIVEQSKSDLEASFHLLSDAKDDYILKQLEAKNQEPVQVLPPRDESWPLAFKCTEVRFYQGARLLWKTKSGPARVRVPKKVAVTLMNGKHMELSSDQFLLEE